MEIIVKFMEQLSQGVNFISGVIGIAVYVLQAMALYTIAARRGINKPWLAWVPVANVWILGAISDQYHNAVKGAVKNKRKLLLGLNIAVTAIAAVLFVALIGIIFDLLMAYGGVMGTGNNATDLLAEALMGNIGGLVLMLLLLLTLSIVSIVLTVFTWIAIYDLFCSCEPANATVYLVVSIVGGFVVSGVHSVFMMICRNKDLGMPQKEAEEVVQTLPEVTEVQE